MKIDNDYINGIMYENFIKRAFKYPPRDFRIGYWEASFGQVHSKVESAIDKFLKRRINKEEREGLLLLKIRMTNTYTKEDLIVIVNEALEVTHRHKEYNWL